MRYPIGPYFRSISVNAWGLFLILALTACERPNRLAITPTVFLQTAGGFSSTISERLETKSPEIFFVTDRMPVDLPNGEMTYSYMRSPAMVFGRTTVRLGDGQNWPGLNANGAAGTAPRLKVVDTEEIVTFESTPLQFGTKNGRARVLDKVQADYSMQRRAFRQRIAAELSTSQRKEVIVFVHGFNNDFDDAITTLANIWHFSGRMGVPIAYTWPAGSPGMFGYFTDRESGEFSIFHLKEFIRMLSEVSGLEAINIIAHSRGSDVVTSALGELVIADRAAGLSPRSSLKIKTLILAAPDLDFGVVQQRLIAERFGPAFGQIIVYLNPKDSALGISERLMRGVRFGRVTFDDLSASDKAIFTRIRNVNFIDVEQIRGTSGHSYFRENPAVISDIILALRTGALPGGTDRPLVPLGGNFWKLRSDYPLGRKPESPAEIGQ